MRLEVEAVSAAPRALVWDLLTDWERQPEWMVDAEAVEVVSARREGVGVTLRCPTDLFGLTVQDVMRVTRWEEQRRVDVVHLGRIIVGTGVFELQDGPGGTTRIVWWEEIDPPLGALGRWGAVRVVLPLVRRIFQRSLTQLAGMAEQEALRRGGLRGRRRQVSCAKARPSWVHPMPGTVRASPARRCSCCS